MDLTCDEAVIMNAIGVEEAVLADREPWPSGGGADFALFLSRIEMIGIPGVDMPLLWKAYCLTDEEIDRNIELNAARRAAADPLPLSSRAVSTFRPEVAQATYDARGALPKTLQSPEQGYIETGGTRLTGPREETR